MILQILDKVKLALDKIDRDAVDGDMDAVRYDVKLIRGGLTVIEQIVKRGLTDEQAAKIARLFNGND